jgi:hypothetical protein
MQDVNVLGIDTHYSQQQILKFCTNRVTIYTSEETRTLTTYEYQPRKKRTYFIFLKNIHTDKNNT